MTFAPEFIDVVHAMRTQIAQARNETLRSQPTSAGVA